jgi:hypothetical protein
VSHRLVLERPTDGETLSLGEDDLGSVSFTREHTALSDFRVRVPYSPELEDYALSEANLWYETPGGDTHLFRGYLTGVHSREERAETELLGYGVEYDLKQSGAVVSYSGYEAWKAVRDYWTNQVPGVSATVHKPPRARMGDITQSATTDAEFADVFTVEDTDPLAIRNGNVEVLASAWWSYSGDFGAGAVVGDAGAEQADAESVSQADESGSNVVTTDYPIPAEHARAAVRYRAPDGATPRAEFRVEGAVFHETERDAAASTSYGWHHGNIPLSGDALPAGGQNVNVNVSQAASNDERVFVDVVVVYDDRFGYTFDNSTDANDLLAGPETRPDAVPLVAEVVETPARVTEVSLSTTWNDTTGSQAIATSLDGETWNEATNAAAVTNGYPSSVRETAYGRVTLSRYGSRTTASPTEGFNGQHLNDYTLTVSGDAPAKIGDTQLEGDHLRNLQRLHELAGMRFVVHHDPDEVTAESFAPGDEVRTAEFVVEDRNRKLDARNYANSVTVRGAFDSNTGERLKATETNAAESARYGTWHYDETDTSLETQTDVDSAAVELLNEKLRELDLTGALSVVPVGVAPGFSYPVEWDAGDPQNTPLERVNYADRSGSLTGRLSFDPPDALELELVGVRSSLRRTNERL